MGAILRVERHFYLSFLRPRLKLHYDATAKTPLKIYYVLVLRLGLYYVYTIKEWFAVAH